MKEDILSQLNDPRQLEKLYHTNKGQFRQEFTKLYPTLKGDSLAEFWNERLTYESDEMNWGTSREFAIIMIVSLIAGLIAKMPVILSISEEFFYPRNIGFIVFPALSAYFAWKHKLSIRKIAFLAGATLAALIFMNVLPDIDQSDTSLLSCIHVLLFLWSILGIAYTGDQLHVPETRLSFLKYNGDLIVMAALMVIAGGIMTAMTIGLFSLIGLNIEAFYAEYIVVFGLAAVPMVGTYLTQTNPLLVGKVSPVIAKIFSPLVLAMLVIYLVAMVYSGKDPYNDREFLLVFNALLVGVMALIFFSIAETTKSPKTKAESWILFLLSVVTIIVNGIALSAIIFRISEWGITPNRLAVLGGNILILLNLLLVAVQLYRVISKNAITSGVGTTIAYFLPIYSLWTVIVTFLFPLIFGFR